MCNGINERKRATEALRELEHHLTDIIDFLPDATFAVDTEGKVIAWNRAIEEMTGIAKDEILNRGGYAYAVPFYGEPRPILIDLVIQDQKEIEPKYSNVIRKGDQLIAEAFAPMLNRGMGAYLWGIASPIYDSDGSIWGAIESIRDTTERKQMEVVLRESKDYLDEIINSIGDPIFVKDRQHRFILVNNALCALANRTHEEFIGKTDYDFFPREQVDVFLQKDEVVFETGKENVNEETSTDSQGVTRTIVTKKTLYTDTSGNKSIVGIIRDITDRKQAEEALRASHQIIERIINAIPVRVFWKDRDLVYLGCNAIFAHDAGFADPKDIVGKDDYQMGWRDQAELYRSDDRQVIESGRSKLHIEEPSTTPEGNTSILLTNKIPLRSSEGEIIGVLGTYMDITERKRAEEALRKAHDELEMRVKERTEELARKNIEMERFIYTVSHDLRTPLISVSGFLGFIEQDAEKGDLERMNADLRIANEALTKMDQLLMETLELSRIGRVVNPPVDAPFEEIVEDAFGQTSEIIRSKGFKVSVDQNLPVVHVDRMRIAEVLVNLIENSIKYMGLQANPEIEIGQRLDGKDKIFFVRDNGIGIEPGQHDKVFELFYKVDKQSDGTGAGLAIVKRILEVHGGRIWIESELKKGCTICFTLPLACGL